MSQSCRYQALFERLDAVNQGAFVPFVTLGDPDKATSLAAIQALIDGGADALELGFPFSDPAADGPVIQAANVRALDSGMKVEDCFDMLSQIRQANPEIPVGLLVYANLVYRKGVENFYQACSDAGVDSVLIADVPVHESQEFLDASARFGVSPIFIAPPNADEATLAKVAEQSQGYTYLVSRAGVTGTETQAGMPVTTQLDTLAKYNAPPAILGFGISQPEQVKSAIQGGAAGAIAGSATVKLIQQHKDDKAQMAAALSAFAKDMKAATQK
ncbi:tryptophan synthase subunit alpha [Paraferrimonas sedimenticola]|uniref:Tryptophan synthase alpha chain n=1 Tax=Paraferrimonas sedimenticola TaxID=375674 RepID=A0AA37VST4_9GAMM|nr:tryptophan synthase subunit alpha [Paraferrimonas sedimenticola]GLP94929.1 tryptophan synthase alpha chain [Paraferrimonas sedimenticola]